MVRDVRPTGTTVATSEADLWRAADAYESFMGRWSRAVADRFLAGLDVPPGRRWLDVGCGVGSLTAAVLAHTAPVEVVGIDPAPAFLERARDVVGTDARVRFEPASAERLPFADGAFDAAVSGLVLNFVPDPAGGLAEMLRVTVPGGTVGAYVWDYDHADFFLTRFWTAVEATGGEPAAGDERGRWRLCSTDGLLELGRRCGLRHPRIRSIEVTTAFPDADALWRGFLLGIGPSGAWVTAQDEERLRHVRASFDAALPAATVGGVRLTARALALTGSPP